MRMRFLSQNVVSPQLDVFLQVLQPKLLGHRDNVADDMYLLSSELIGHLGVHRPSAERAHVSACRLSAGLPPEC